MSDPWAGFVPTVVTSAATALVTLGITGGVRAVARRREATKVPLTLRRGAANTWRLRNERRGTLYGIEYAVVSEDEPWRQVVAAAGGGRINLKRGEETYIEDLAADDTLLIAWVRRRDAWPKSGRIHTAELRLRPGVLEYDIYEGALTWGWGYGLH